LLDPARMGFEIFHSFVYGDLPSAEGAIVRPGGDEELGATFQNY
jgi:hypothetical protein